jgi:type IV pilus assembly protein PilX
MNSATSPLHQQGATLITVLIIMLLTMTAVLAGYRASSLNEIITSNSSDYLRAVAAAEALIRDAEIDIRGRVPPYSPLQADGAQGAPCRPSPTNPLMSATGFMGCRDTSTGRAYFPRSSEDYDTIETIVSTASSATRCQDGICIPPDLNMHANIENNLAIMAPLGATYGQHTRSAMTAPGAQGNPILTAATAQAWYWVEVFKYSSSLASTATTASHLIPDPSAPFVYRITAVARGLKDGTQVVIKTTFVPYPASQGQ